MGKIKIEKKELQKLVKKGLKDSEISKILNVKTISIFFARKRYNIIRDSFIHNKPFKLTKKHKEFFVGCLLGDGTLRIGKNCINPRFSCEHGIKQKEYVKYKINILKKLNPHYRESKRKNVDIRTGVYYESAIVTLKTNSSLLEFYNSFYQPKKVISKEMLKYYTPFAMAIHFMDDGCLSANGYYIATQSFDINSINLLREKLLNEYNVKTNIHKGNYLYILKESVETFTKLIKPYFIKSMMCKLHNI